MSKKKRTILQLKARCYVYDVIFQYESDEDHGKTDTAEKTIYINTRFSEQIQRETLFHEIMHIAYEDCAYFGKDDYKAEDQEEDLIRYASPILVQIYQDTSWLQRFIFDQLGLDDVQ